MKQMSIHACNVSIMVLLVLSLTACDGDSGGADDKQIHTGVFVGGPVSGLAFESPTQSGDRTDAGGRFTYRSGETVRFYVGDMLIGQAPGAATISPFDLAGQSIPVSGPDIWRVVIQMINYRVSVPFDKVINLAVFLTTLDADGEAANGIQIPDRMHDLTGGIDLDFDQPHEDFIEDFAFRRLMAAGNSAGLWHGGRAINSPKYALDDLYGALGLTPTIFVMDSSDRDTDGDGTVDKRTIYGYDAFGQRTLYEQGPANDISVDYRQERTYNDAGRLVRQETDRHGDGLDILTEVYEYDANGWLVLHEVDTDGNGTLDYRVTFGYDDYGSRIFLETDSNGDGTRIVRETYSYDDSGHPTLYERDVDDNDSVDERRFYTYDTNGHLVLWESDFNADDTIDGGTRYSYDAAGNKTLVEHFSGTGETVTSRRRYAYDAYGNVVLEEYDRDADGNVDRRNTLTYNDRGYLVEEEADPNGDGTEIQRTFYRHNAAGQLTSKEEDGDGDNVAEARTTYTYDADGNLTSSERDDDIDDGDVNHRSSHRYIPVNRWSGMNWEMGRHRIVGM
jgi:YD repeat-containing protein